MYRESEPVKEEECRLGPDCRIDRCPCQLCQKTCRAAIRVREAMHLRLDQLMLEVLEKRD